jgi:hypothetical protein
MCHVSSRTREINEDSTLDFEEIVGGRVGLLSLRRSKNAAFPMDYLPSAAAGGPALSVSRSIRPPPPLLEMPNNMRPI